LPICQNPIEGLFKDLQGYEEYIRTKLNQTCPFISIYKRYKLPQWGLGRKWILCTFEIRKKPSETPFSVSIGRSRHFRKLNSRTFKDLQTQIQGLSRTMFSRTFRALKIWREKNSRTFKDPQEPCINQLLKFNCDQLRNRKVLISVL